MAKVLLLMSLPADVQATYATGLCAAFPEIEFALVGDLAAAEPHLADADVLITYGQHLRDQADRVFRAMPKLRWVQLLGVGVDNVIERPGLAPDVIVSNVQGLHGPAISECVLGSLFALSRRIPEVVRNQEAHRWDRLPARLLTGGRIGIIGSGAVAQALAPRCAALGMRPVGFSTSPRSLAGFEAVLPRDALAQHVGDLDALVLLISHGPETHHLADAALLGRMKPTAFLVNVGRGGVVDEAALRAALIEGRLGGAALDVFEIEPLPIDDPLWDSPRLLITSHTAGFHERQAEETLPVLIGNLERFLAGDVAGMRFVVPRRP